MSPSYTTPCAPPMRQTDFPATLHQPPCCSCPRGSKRKRAWNGGREKERRGKRGGGVADKEQKLAHRLLVGRGFDTRLRPGLARAASCLGAGRTQMPAGRDSQWLGKRSCKPTNRGRLSLSAASPHAPFASVSEGCARPTDGGWLCGTEGRKHSPRARLLGRGKI